MSYKSVSACASDQAFFNRVQSCVVEQQLANDQPVNLGVAGPMLWTVASADDIEAAYEYALNSENPDPGGDETVITDTMILGAVQANWALAQNSSSMMVP